MSLSSTSVPESCEYEFSSIPGLYLVTEYCSTSFDTARVTRLPVAKELTKYIKKQPWDSSLKREVQHYGYKYQNTRSASGFSKNKAIKATPIQGCLLELKEYIEEYLEGNLGLTAVFDQCIVNKYSRKDGIGAHTDDLSFGPIVVSVSLGASCNFEFSRENKKCTVWVPQLSLLILTGESRTEWKHAVPNNIRMAKSDNYLVVGDDYTIEKRDNDWERISVTFRSVDY